MPIKASFRPSQFGITLGTDTPGESIRYIKGFSNILNPLVPLVVQTEAVTLLTPRLFSKSEMFLSWLRMEDLPTLGIPQAMNHCPTCLYLLLYFSLSRPMIMRMSSCLVELTAKHVIPQSLYSLMTFLVFSWLQMSILLKITIFYFWAALMTASNSELWLEKGSRASLISMNTSTSWVLSFMILKAFCMCPGNQLIFSLSRAAIGLSFITQLQYYAPCLLYFNNKMAQQASQFCFKYCINLGNNKFGSMTVTEKTNLYEEAQRFCHRYSLEPYIAAVLENQMFQEILKIKEGIAVQNHHQAAKSGQLSKHIRQDLEQSTQKSITKVEGPACEGQKKSTQNSTAITNKKSKGKNNNHFEEMFRKYEQIQNKKQLSRKASLQKIPFKPTINNLSRKIVDFKRNSSNNLQEYGNSDKNMTTKFSGSSGTRSKSSLKQNLQNVIVMKTSTALRPSRSRSRLC